MKNLKPNNMSYTDLNGQLAGMMQREGLGMKQAGANTCSGYILERQLIKRFKADSKMLLTIPENTSRTNPKTLNEINWKLQKKGVAELEDIAKVFNDKGYRFAFIKLFGFKGPTNQQ